MIRELIWVQVPALPHISSVILGKSLSFSLLQHLLCTMGIIAATRGHVRINTLKISDHSDSMVIEAREVLETDNLVVEALD